MIMAVMGGMMHVVDPDELRNKFYTVSPEHYLEMFGGGSHELPHFQGEPTQRGTGGIGSFIMQYGIPLIGHLVRGVVGAAQRQRKRKADTSPMGSMEGSGTKKRRIVRKRRKRKRVTKKATQATTRKRRKQRKRRASTPSFSIFDRL